MSAHTPGPWRVEVSREYATVFAGNESQPIAEIATSHGDTFGPRQRADADLIAAAPDLLAAAIRVRDNAFGPTRAAALADLYIAITKAGGGK